MSHDIKYESNPEPEDLEWDPHNTQRNEKEDRDA